MKDPKIALQLLTAELLYESAEWKLHMVVYVEAFRKALPLIHIALDCAIFVESVDFC